ncbi:MAG: hypothetical protein HMLKMBBP_00337 [Planctomycetes bacterium]|nr:hypothetical protein [Planctomycetota bacterium]
MATVGAPACTTTFTRVSTPSSGSRTRKSYVPARVRRTGTSATDAAGAASNAAIWTGGSAEETTRRPRHPWIERPSAATGVTRSLNSTPACASAGPSAARSAAPTLEGPGRGASALRPFSNFASSDVHPLGSHVPSPTACARTCAAPSANCDVSTSAASDAPSPAAHSTPFTNTAIRFAPGAATRSATFPFHGPVGAPSTATFGRAAYGAQSGSPRTRFIQYAMGSRAENVSASVAPST